MTANYQILCDFCKGELKPLYDYIYRPLLLHASRCLTDRFAFLAEDCVQDSIFQAYKKRYSFSTLAALKTYLYTSVRNKSIDILRNSNAQERFLTTYPTSESIFLDILEREAMDRLFKAVDNLPEKDRKLFLLFWDGHKIKEVAAMLGLAESTIKSRKAKMIAKLKELVADEGALILLMAVMSEQLFS